MYDGIVGAVAAVVLVVCGFVLPPFSWPPRLKSLIGAAVVARIVGATVRYIVVVVIYGGGDAIGYYARGRRIADGLRSFDFEPWLDTERLWGTPFVDRIAAIFLTVLGPSIKALWLVFSMFSLVGLSLMLITVHRHCRGRLDGGRLPLLLLFWPSLVFWPSSIGKEAIVLLAAGLVIYGWRGRGRIHWPTLSAGLILALGLRPHIAMMMGVAIAAADWLKSTQTWTAGSIARGVVLLLVGVGIGVAGLGQLGIDQNLDSVENYVELRSGQTATGGSSFDATTGPLVVPMAFVNVLFRPFIWEARNPFILFSALEMTAFWVMVYRNRRASMAMVRNWRSSALLAFVVPFALVLTFFYGAFVSNMGILARQRVIVLPLLFIVAEMAPLFVRRTGTAKPTPPHRNALNE